MDLDLDLDFYRQKYQGFEELRANFTFHLMVALKL